MNEVRCCTIDETEHGSDHSAIRTELAIEWQSPNAKPRRLWRKTRWVELRRMVKVTKDTCPEPEDHNSVNECCEYIMWLVLPAIEKTCPNSETIPLCKTLVGQGSHEIAGRLHLLVQ